jgi:prepilin-type processing-associated H-X9-DG protein
MVLIEDDSDTPDNPEPIDTGCFGIDPNSASLNINNWPALYHGQGTTIGFADGHADYIRWHTATPNQGWINVPVGNTDVLLLKSMEAVLP